MNGTSAEYQHSIPQRVILISLACLLTLVASLSLSDCCFGKMSNRHVLSLIE